MEMGKLRKVKFVMMEIRIFIMVNVLWTVNLWTLRNPSAETEKSTFEKTVKTALKISRIFVLMMGIKSLNAEMERSIREKTVLIVIKMSLTVMKMKIDVLIQKIHAQSFLVIMEVVVQRFLSHVEIENALL